MDLSTGLFGLLLVFALSAAWALWIVPVCMATAALLRSKAKVQWPWFILLFVLAAGINTF